MLLQDEVQVAIRGTGHMPCPGSANVQDGVTIDMRGLKGIKLNEDEPAVDIAEDKPTPTEDIAAGETWSTVYEYLQDHNLTTAGGRNGGVGVAGLLLGGGLSMFSTRTGFACDSVLDFEIVLASGEIVHANKLENADLWKSLKGGVNNFGIVTSLKMRTFRSEDIWGGVTYYMPEPNTFGRLLRQAIDFVYNEKDEDTHIMCSVGYGFGQQALTCVMYQTRGVKNAPSLKRFTSLEPRIEQRGTMRTSNHLGFCDELSKFSSNGARQYWTTLTIKPDIHLMEAMHKKWQETLANIKNADGLVFSFGFQPLTKALLQSSSKAGGNAADILPSDGPLFIVLINPSWKSHGDDEKIFKEVTAFVESCRQMAREKDLLHRYLFTNYAWKTDDILSGYGENSLAMMMRVSKKFDPEGVFQKSVPGWFKLSNRKPLSSADTL